MSERPLRVLVVDDTVTYRKIVTEILSRLPGVEVVGVAANGKIALLKIEELRPDLLTLDLEMPEIDGLGVLRALKEKQYAVGALMLSALTTQGADATVAALKLGAFDFVLKPIGSDFTKNSAALESELRQKVEAFMRTRRPTASPAPRSRPPAPSAPPAEVVRRTGRVSTAPGAKPEVVVVGISTGGPQALSRMVPLLPADLAAPVLIVQHMPPKFTLSLANDLATRCRLRPSEACDGDLVQPGRVLIAPGGRQMRLVRSERGGPLTLRITDDPPENHCRPSVDYLFRSVASTCGGRVVAVIMTGMGNDGTLGLRLLKQQGASIIAQDERSCVVFGMPKLPIEEGLADVIAPLDQIADEITRLTGRGVLACS